MLSRLSYPFKKQWYFHSNIAVIGWSYNAVGTALKEGSLAHLFEEVTDIDSFAVVLTSLNGHFAVVIETDRFSAAAVDHIRSIPILIRQDASQLEIFCGIEELDFKLNESEGGSFEESWCVPGNNTLGLGIQQLLPGQFIWRERNSHPVQPTFYFKHFNPVKSNLAREVHLEKGSKILDQVFERLTGQISDKKILVPLSGGYDSRLILAMLHLTGVKELSAFTYGRRQSHEAVIAKAVCSQLNIDWHFVEYDENLFQEFFSDAWKTYSRKNHFLSSLPHEQDFFALHVLKERGVLSGDFMVMPGYCGDLLGGSITANRPQGYNEPALRDQIKRKHFGNKGIDPVLTVHDKIESPSSYYDNYQQYFVENKVSKFIVNAVRVYEFYNGDWIMPLWDRELVDFFYALPYELREKQGFYNQLLFEKVFTPLGIDIVKPGHDDNYPSQIKEKLKSVLPDSVVGRLRSIKREGVMADPNGLQILNQMIYEQLSNNLEVCPDEINTTHANYFLQNLKK